jgi:peptidyl-prolyl cis-trans isomerase C
MPDIHVNGSVIPEAAIIAEVQNHPAGEPDRAISAATEALIVRELLLQEARELALEPMPETDSSGRRETDEDALIRQLLEVEITVPVADEDACRRYFENNRKRFRSTELFEAAHILFACDPEDSAGYEKAAAAATETIAMLEQDPAAFGSIARARSDCTSGKSDGRLGQIARGDTVPEFETFLAALEEGQLCSVPVKSRYGAHVLRLDKKVPGRDLPFDAVKDRIAGYLQERSWRRAVSDYIDRLASYATIEGADPDGEPVVKRATAPHAL